MPRAACVLVVCACVLAPGGVWAQDNQSLGPQSLGPSSLVPAPPPRRPSLLIPMYVSFATLQGLDYVTTTRALSSGAGREANPVMGAVVGNRAAFLAVKAGTAAGTVWIAERMWKKHPRRARVMMAVANGAMGLIVAHNAGIR